MSVPKKRCMAFVARVQGYENISVGKIRHRNSITGRVDETVSKKRSLLFAHFLNYP
jgi:hypothetical protein